MRSLLLCSLLLTFVFNSLATTCQYPEVCPLQRDNTLNLDFGDLLKYNVFTFGNFTNKFSNPSDVEGRVAVGGNHSVPLGHSIGERLCPTLSEISDSPNVNNATCQNLDPQCCQGYDSNNLIVRGSSVWTGGRLYWGGGCVGDLNNSKFGQFAEEFGFSECIFGECQILDGLTPGCQISDSCVPINSWWDEMHQKLENISDTLYNLPSNGVTFWEASATPDSPAGGFDYSGSPHPWTHHLWLQPLGETVNVFSVQASQLGQATSFFWAVNPGCASLFDQSSLSNCPFVSKPEPNDYIIINVLAQQGEDCQVDNINLLALLPWAHRLIWNFGKCRNVQFGDGQTGMGVYGMVLAPNSRLTAKGHIDGHVFVGSFVGTAQINLFEFSCVDNPREPECVDECTNLFGCASLYNVFVFDNYYGESDVQGRLAAGGAVEWTEGFSIGDQLFDDSQGFNKADWDSLCTEQFGEWNQCDFCDPCGQSVLVAGGKITPADESRVYFGNWLSQNLSHINETDTDGPAYGTVNFYGASLLDEQDCSQVSSTLADGFVEARDHLKELNGKLCQLSPTGFVKASYPDTDGGIGFLRLMFFGNPSHEVVYINGTELLAAHTFDINGVTEGSTLIFNVVGQVSGITAINLTKLEPFADKILWNFCDAQNLIISNVALWGSVLAPHANIIGGPGVVHGQIFANSLRGPTQVNWVPFRGCVTVCRPRDTPTPSPSPSPSALPTPSGTAAPTPSGTAAPTPSGTSAPTPSGTAAPTPSGTSAPTPSGTSAPTPSGTSAPTPSGTSAPTPSGTSAPTPSGTSAPTPSGTSAPTPSGTSAPTPSGTSAPTPSGTSAPTPSGTSAPTPSPSPTPSASRPPNECQGCTWTQGRWTTHPDTSTLEQVANVVFCGNRTYELCLNNRAANSAIPNEHWRNLCRQWTAVDLNLRRFNCTLPQPESVALAYNAAKDILTNPLLCTTNNDTWSTLTSILTNYNEGLFENSGGPKHCDKSTPTLQCIVNDAYALAPCRYFTSKSFWLGAGDKAGLSDDFQCNHEDNPESAVQCIFEEKKVNKATIGKFLGTVCNTKDRNYCLDFDVTFSKYHGLFEITNGIWDGINKDGFQSPYFHQFSEECWDWCYGEIESADECVEPFNISSCPCVQNGKYFDYFEQVLGTFVAHPGSPWEGLEGKIKNRGPSAQRGWGGNVFNLQYGLSTWITFVIEKAPTNPETLGNLELLQGYASDFDFNLDECILLEPNTRIRTPPAPPACDPKCGTEQFSEFGDCIDDFLQAGGDLTEEQIAELLEKYYGKCLCAPGYTGPNSEFWGDEWVVADYCDEYCRPVEINYCELYCDSNGNDKRSVTKRTFGGDDDENVYCRIYCNSDDRNDDDDGFDRRGLFKRTFETDDNEEEICVEYPVQVNNGSAISSNCSIKYFCDGLIQNPWPTCEFAYNFIGTVELCTPEDVLLNPIWTSHFYVDSGVVVEQLWSSQVGDWNQDGTKVTVSSAGWDNGYPPQCFKLYFRATKPNPYAIQTVNDFNDSHCAFMVDFPEVNQLIQIKLGNDRKRSETSDTSDECVTFQTRGCFQPDISNMKPPGSDCGTIFSQTTPTECPVCSDNQISLLLQEGGDKIIQDYLSKLEDELDLDRGTFIVVAVDNTDSSDFNIQVYVNTRVTSVHKVVKKLRHTNYDFSVNQCQAPLGVKQSAAQILTVTFTAFAIMAISFVMLF